MPKNSNDKEKRQYLSALLGLFERALLILQRDALPCYLQNIRCTRPPVAERENSASAAAILLLVAGLDWHLARLKYLRDFHAHNPPLPHTPYFNWEIDDGLSTKIKNLLVLKSEKRLQAELIEITAVRDSLAHPKLYVVEESFRHDPELSLASFSAKLAPGVEHRPKTLGIKRLGTEYTKKLNLPLVPTNLSYRDAVLVLIVIHRFMAVLYKKYGDPYARVGSFYAPNQPQTFLGEGRSGRSLDLTEWVKRFYDLLSESDQKHVQKTNHRILKYLEWPSLTLPPRKGKGTMSDILKQMKPDRVRRRLSHLSKPPPWPKVPVKL